MSYALLAEGPRLYLPYFCGVMGGRAPCPCPLTYRDPDSQAWILVSRPAGAGILTRAADMPYRATKVYRLLYAAAQGLWPGLTVPWPNPTPITVQTKGPDFHLWESKTGDLWRGPLPNNSLIGAVQGESSGGGASRLITTPLCLDSGVRVVREGHPNLQPPLSCSSVKTRPSSDTIAPHTQPLQ